jgi:ParB-like nuclease domain
MALAAKARRPASPASGAASRRNKLHLVATDGEIIPPERDLEITADQVVVDRDQLRALRLSEAAGVIFAKAKGDNAIAAIRARKGGSARVILVNPYDLHIEQGHNPRNFDTDVMRERVAGYAQSIATRGVRQPLDVYAKNNTLYINGGETRWRATLHAINFLNVPVEGVPVILSQGENEAERKINMWLGNDVNRFEPMAEATLFRSYVDLGGDLRVFCRRIGRPVGYANDRIRLLEMPDWLQVKVTDGVVSPRTAMEEIWLPSGESESKARQMLGASVKRANAEGVNTVRPRHVRAAETGGDTTIVRTRLHDQLGVILRKHERTAIEQWFGADDATALFKLAKLD